MKFIYFLLSLFLLTSCSVSRGTQTETAKIQFDSSAIKHKDSTGVSKEDSSASVKKDSTGVSKKEESDFVNVGLEFADEDSASGPVKVIISGEALEVDPGGRKLKSVKFRAHKFKSTADSTRSITDAKNQLGKYDSTTVKSTEDAKILSLAKLKNKETKRETNYWPPWWLWLIVIFVGLLYYRYRRWKQTQEYGVPVFKDPPPTPKKKIPDFEHIPATPEVPIPPEKDNFSSTPMI